MKETAAFYRYAQRKVSAKGGMALREYADYESISGYALDAMAWANANGLITGDAAGMLNPQRPTTRAQVATILMRFIQNIAR